MRKRRLGKHAGARESRGEEGGSARLGDGLAVGPLKVEGLHGDQVDEAPVRVLQAQRQLHRRAIHTQLLAHLPDHLRAHAGLPSD
jgi:hypothetical protein